MKKVTKLVLMLCLTLSGALCHASGVAEQVNEKEVETPKIVKIKAQHRISAFAMREKGLLNWMKTIIFATET